MTSGSASGKWQTITLLDVAGLDQRLGLFEDLLQIERDEEIGAGVRGDVAQLVHGVERVAVDHGAAGEQHAVIGDDVERRIGQQQRDAGALLDAELRSAARRRRP